MRILEVIPTLRSGGAERFIVDLSNELSKKDDIEIVLLTLYDISESDIFANLLSNKIKLYSLHKKKGFDFTLCFRIFRLICKIRPNIVHSHLGVIIYLIFPVFFNFRSVKYYHTIHNDAYEEAYGIQRLFRKILFHWSLCTPVTISKISKDSFEKLYESDAPLIFNGVSCNNANEFVAPKYRSSEHTKVLVNIGRVMKQKNHLMLLKVFSRLVEDGEDIVLLHIGRIGEQSLYEELMPYINNRIFFLGEMENPRPYLKDADLFCLTSLFEGLPISLLEAFSVGCIPVCTPAGGCVDIIQNGITGFISGDMSEDAYYMMLRKVLNADLESLNLIKSNILRKYEEKYSIEICSREYLNLFFK